MALRLNVASSVYGFQNGSLLCRTQRCVLGIRQHQSCQPCPRILSVMNMASGKSDDRGKLSLSYMMDKARAMWDSSPQPVKSFPWNRALENFIQLILDLYINVVKYLSIPLFAISSVSEISYCAHERKLFLVPLMLLVGSVVAGVLRDAVLDSSPYLKGKLFSGLGRFVLIPVSIFLSTHHEAVPWHLISMLIFFILLKCLGPYYTYWGRLVIPHVANGVLLRTLWFMFQWYRRPQKSSETVQPVTITIPSPGPNNDL